MSYVIMLQLSEGKMLVTDYHYQNCQDNRALLSTNLKSCPQYDKEVKLKAWKNCENITPHRV